MSLLVMRRGVLGAVGLLATLLLGPAPSFGQGAGKLTCATPVTLGTAGNDILNGNSAANTLGALAGDDIVNGLQGNDCLDGGPDDDTLNGGDGNDFIFGRAG